jgi:O-antigen ligase
VRPVSTPALAVPRGRIRKELALGFAAAVAAGYVLGAGGTWQVALAVATILALSVAGIANPLPFLFLFLLIRPLMDALGEERSSFLGLPALNVASILALMLIVVTALALRRAEKRVLPRTLLWLAVVFAASSLAALYALGTERAVVGSKPLAELVRLAACVAIYALAANLATTVGVARRLFVVAAVSGVIPSIDAIYQWTKGAPVAADLSISRVAGTFSGPNALGEFLAVVIILLFALPARVAPRWVRLTALLPCLVAEIGTFSRTGWLMVAIGIVVLEARRRPRRVALALLAVALLIAAVPNVRHRFTAADQTSVATHSRWVPSSYQWRVETWRVLLRKYREKPLTGFGLRTTEALNPRRNTDALGSTGYGAHNSVVKLLFEGGPLLLLAYIALFGALMRRTWRLSTKRWRLAGLARATFVLWALIAFIGITTDDPLEATAILYVLFAVTGALEGAGARAPALTE